MDPNHFPSRLHEMLREINDSGDGTAKIVSWQPHGKCFLIKNKEEFIDKVLPRSVTLERGGSRCLWCIFVNPFSELNIGGSVG